MAQNPHRNSRGRPRAGQIPNEIVIEPGCFFGWTASFSQPGFTFDRKRYWTWRIRKEAAYRRACRKRDIHRLALDKMGVKWDAWEAKREIRTCTK